MAESTQIEIEVEYITHSKEQSVFINLSSNKKLRSGLNEPVKMKSSDGRHWSLTIDLPKSKVGEIDFGFTVRSKHEFVDEEKGHGQYSHHLPFHNTPHISVKALWHSDMGKNYYYSSAFADTINPFTPDPSSINLIEDADLVLSFTDFQPQKGSRLVLCGNTPETGNWDPQKGVPGIQICTATWAFPLSYSSIPKDGLKYKFTIINAEGDAVWEAGDNHTLLPPTDQSGKTIIDVVTPVLPIDLMKTAGVVVPLFSLRTESDWGIGDFNSLTKLIDWAAEAGLHAIQLLPVNDTTREGNWHDSYPYNPISTFALHPIYMDFAAMPPVKSKTVTRLLEQRRGVVNSLPLIDYDEVFDLKEKYLHTWYHENKHDILRSTRYKIFKRDNSKWLVPYSFFRYLLKQYGTANFRHWPRFREYNGVELQRWAIANNKIDDIEFYSVVQYMLDKQFRQVHEYAKEKGIILKGDIPIGVSRDSVSAWVLPKYLNSDQQAGAPPDMFSSKGQNWGFPTYNWKNILDDGAIWWQERLQHMANYFDAYRIDHVLGFFRIWEIPIQHIYGTLGHFNPALPLSESELKIMGFTDNPATYTRPRFTEGELKLHFGELLPVAKEYFFQFESDNHWTFQPRYASSQRAIDAKLREMGFSGDQRELFLSAYTNTLFIPSEEEANKYHLNILGPETREYKHLSPHDATAYSRIYQYFFYERHNKYWADRAYERLPKLTCATRMLTCAEDLGMIPACVPPVLKDLNILTLEIQTMPKQPNRQFSDLNENPLYSVDTISTHDMPPLRLWWKQNPEAAAAFVRDVLGKDSNTNANGTTLSAQNEIKNTQDADRQAQTTETEAQSANIDRAEANQGSQKANTDRQDVSNEPQRASIDTSGNAQKPQREDEDGVLSPEMAYRILALHMQSSSLLSIISLQDWLSISPTLRSDNLEAEQINHPEIPHHYWRWRMPCTIEQMASDPHFTSDVHKLASLRVSK